MKLIRVKGNTYYLDAEEAIPVYVLKDGSCIMIDSGWEYERNDIEDAFAAYGLIPAGIIGTHVHTDHSGNHRYFQEKYKIPIVLSEGEAGIAYSNLTIKSYLYVFSPEEIAEEKKLNQMQVFADKIIKENDTQIELAGVTFEIMHTKGHSPDHIAVITPDGVICLGDALLSEDILTAAKLPYFFSVADALQTMEDLGYVTYPSILSHKGTCLHTGELAARNQEILYDRIRMVERCISHKMSMENIITTVCEKLKLLSGKKFKAKLYERDVRNYVEYLADQKRIHEFAEFGRIYYEPMENDKKQLKAEDIIIRKAKISDYDSVNVLEEMIFDIHRQAKPDYFKNLDQSYSKAEFEELLSCSGSIALVAVRDETVAGICFGKIEAVPENQFCRSRKIAFIQDLAVLPDFQGEGIAAALMDKAREQAKKENAVSIELCVWNFNEGAIQFYEKQGMNTQYIRMELTI